MDKKKSTKEKDGIFKKMSKIMVIEGLEEMKELKSELEEIKELKSEITGYNKDLKSQR